MEPGPAGRGEGTSAANRSMCEKKGAPLSGSFPGGGERESREWGGKEICLTPVALFRMNVRFTDGLSFLRIFFGVTPGSYQGKPKVERDLLSPSSNLDRKLLPTVFPITLPMMAPAANSENQWIVTETQSPM
jgi:hypothetical protein